MKKWLDELDSELLRIRNQFGHIYYQGFLDGNLDVKLISEVSEHRKHLLANPSFETLIDLILSQASTGNSTGSAVKRKACLLQELLEAERIEGADLFISAKANIQKQEIEFIPIFGANQKGYSARRSVLSQCESKHERYNAYVSLMPLLNHIENKCHEFIETANTLSSGQGHSDYFDFRLSLDELSFDEIDQDLESVLKATEDDYKEFLDVTREVVGSEMVEAYDLRFTQTKILMDFDLAFSGERAITDLGKTLNSCSIDLNSFPVSIERADTSNAGTCFALGSNDYRLILGTETGYFGHYVAFHELGHAFHYSLQPKSVLLADRGMSLEVMADFFASILTDPSWLAEYTAMQDSKVTSLLRMKRLADSYRLRTMVRDTRFEREIFECSGESFEIVWERLNREILLLSTTEAVWDPFLVYRPCYTKNYLYSYFLSKKLAKIRTDRYGSFTENPNAHVKLFSEIAKVGNRIPFIKRMKNVGLDSIRLVEHIDL